MICPKCESSNGDYYEAWDEYWDGEDYQSYLCRWWDCFDCQSRVQSYDDEYEDEE